MNRSRRTLCVTLVSCALAALAALGPALAQADGDCGLSVISGLADLAGPARHRAALDLDPVYRSWIAGGGLSWVEGDVEAAWTAARATCFGPEVVAESGAYEAVASSAHFSVYRASGAAPMAAAVDGVLDALEEALDGFTDLGWRRPGGIDDWQVMVFLQPLPGGLGGYTWVAPCAEAPDGVMDWIVLSESWATSDLFREPLVAHELFHGVQRRYAFDEYVTGFEGSASRWWVEASAVYAEGLVFPESLDLAAERSAQWGVEPWKSLFLFDSVLSRHYQVFVFPLSIEASLADSGWLRPFWEQLDGRSGFALREELDGFLAARGTRFDAEFGAYMARASEMDLPRYPFLVGPRDLQAFSGIDGGMAARYAATELPADGAVAPGDPEAPQGLGGSYVWFGTTAAAPGRALRVDVELDAFTPDGDPVEWVVEVVAARAGSVAERASFVPTPGAGADPQRLAVTVHGVGENADGVWLIATRLDEHGGPSPGWSWGARLVRGDDALAIERSDGGCGCAHLTGPDPGAGLLLLGALVLGRHRRRPGILDRCRHAPFSLSPPS